jgi:hypothetical protein
MRLSTMGRVIPILVSPLHLHSLLSLPLEAKLILATISPTIATMKLYGHRFRLGMGLFIWFLSTQHLNRFLLTWLLNRFSSLVFSLSFTLELDGFLEVVGLWRKHGWSWGCV